MAHIDFVWVVVVAGFCKDIIMEDQTVHYIAIGYLLSDTCYKNLRIRISTDRKLSSFFSKFPLNESRKSLFPDKSRELTLTGRTSAKITLIHRLSKT